MGQIHKRFTNEQIRFLFGAYVHGHIKRMDVQEALGIGKSRFFELLREYLSTLDEARAVLREEVDRYNNHQVHSTTGEVPGIRFARAYKEGTSLFRPFSLPKPYTSPR